MAEALLTLMFKNLNSLIQKGFGLLWGVNKEMEKLSSILSTIRAVLEDAEEKQLRNRAIKNWLQKLNDVSGELDDILDECSAEASLLEYKTKRFGSTQKVKASFLNCLNPKNTRFRFQIAKKMEDVTERLDDIAKEREKFHLREVVEDQRHVQVRNKRDTGSIVDEKQVYGREEDKDKIVEFLVESNSSNSKDCPSTCAIVGMGGIGKTTLAKLVYNDPRVTEHFDMKIWVCVSGDFDMWRLIKAIIESASGSACEALDIDPLQKRLQNMLERKKFLLVLDDVWNEDKDKWEGLGNVLACGLNGSSIVVTTRLEKVASIMGATQMHHISSLSEDECWLLFSQRAFGSESEKRPSLVKIGKEIVKKCKGNPLAAKSLGSLMYSKFEEQQWLLVKESELWQIDETSILPALRLSYYQLTSQLRRCFAFCAIFPKDFEIKKEKLIHLWMANGLIFSKENMEVEEMGNEICNELYWRSFFQDAEKDEFGNIKSFKMHDLVHDLAQCIMKDECTVTKSDLPDIFSTFYNGKSLRTLLLLPMSSSMAQARLPHSLYFPSLRAFDRQDIFISELKLKTISSLISNSIHLRYLNLSRTKIRFLPESICLLVNLQTLDVRLCGKLEKLPKHMSRLRSLRHLYIEGCLSLNQMPPNIGKLSCLRSLSRYIVYRRRGYDIDELGSLLNLGGSLRIEQLEKVRSPMEAKKANLVGKTNLETLHLCWCDNLNEVGDQKLSEQVLDALEPPPTLKVLEISDFTGGHLPHWFNANFENLVRIRFTEFRNISELPTAMGKLPSLTSLYLRGMDCLQYVDNESYDGQLFGGFFRLETLSIFCLRNLERLCRVERSDIFPRLSNLYIGGCPKLTSLHCLPSIDKLIMKECNGTVLESVSNLHTLTSLEIVDNDDLASFPDGFLHNLTALKSLEISKFRKLQNLPSDMLIDLTALEELSISFCHMLECFPTGIFQGLISLKMIRIEECRKLKSLSDSFGDLTALESLQLRGCPELETFPNGLNNLSSLQYLTLLNFYKAYSKLPALPENLQHLPSLKSMEISGFSNLEKLPDWLGDLTSLESLSIDNCLELQNFPKGLNNLSSLQRLTLSGSKLAALPENLQHLPSLKYMRISRFPNLEKLPEWLGDLTSLSSLSISYCHNLEYLPKFNQHLTNLESLEIRTCSKLMERCKKGIGEDWHKIAHIPRIHVWSAS